MLWWLCIYNILAYALLPFVFVRLLWLSRKDADYRSRWKQRFGYVDMGPEHVGRESLWVHTVSLGETIAATRLIFALCERYPNYTIVVTSMTPSGYRQARKTFVDNRQVVCCHVPYDAMGLVKRFLSRVRPVMAIIMETEWWPNIWYHCNNYCKIPLIVANGRLSERSFNAYACWASVVRHTLQCVTLYAAQSEADAKRVIKLGLDPARVVVLGNVKFDRVVDGTCMKEGKALRAVLGQERKIWIAAGTHQGEEEIVLKAHQKLLEQHPLTGLILVPRHPSRADEVIALCQSYGFRVVRRTAPTIDDGLAVDIFLGDTCGELMMFYAASDVAFVGGSLVPVGGHNLLEPAYFELPVLTGPHMFNFVAVNAWMIDAGAACCVQDEEQLASKVGQLLSDQDLCVKMGQSGQKVIAEHTGAVDRHLQQIDVLLTRQVRGCETNLPE